MEARGVEPDSRKAEKRRVVLTVFLLLFFGTWAGFYSMVMFPRFYQVWGTGDGLEVPAFSTVVFRFHDLVRANLIVFAAVILVTAALFIVKERLVSNRALVHRLNRAGVIVSYIVLTGYLVVLVIALWLPKYTFGTGDFSMSRERCMLSPTTSVARVASGYPWSPSAG